MSKLQSALNKIAKGGEKAEELKTWLRSITDEKTGLIEKLIAGMILQWGDKVKDTEFIKRSLSLFRFPHHAIRRRRLLDCIPEVVYGQIKKSKTFAALISSYIEEVPVEGFIGDEFVILAYLAQGKKMKGAKSMKLIEKLFDSLEHLKNPIVFSSIVSLIVAISFELAGHSENYVIEVCAKHPNSRYIEETLVQLINKPNPRQIVKYLQFAIDALESPLTKETFFYVNDINVMLEALLRDLDNTKKADVRLKYLELIKLIVQCPQYLTFRHKWEDMFTLMNDMTTNLDLDKETIAACSAILEAMRVAGPMPGEKPEAEGEEVPEGDPAEGAPGEPEPVPEAEAEAPAGESK